MQAGITADGTWGSEEAGVGRTDLVISLDMGVRKRKETRVTPGSARAHACMLMSFPSRKRWVKSKNIFLLMFFTL